VGYFPASDPLDRQGREIEEPEEIGAAANHGSDASITA
jgi:hypothetical protein